jgi:hypothetical protein
MVADHQGRWHKGGVTSPPTPALNYRSVPEMLKPSIPDTGRCRSPLSRMLRQSPMNGRWRVSWDSDRLSISVCFRAPTRDTGRRGRLCSGGANSDDGPVSRRHGGGVGGKRGWIHCDRRDRGCGQPLQAAVASGVVHLVERRRLLPCVVGCLRGPCHEGFTTQTFVNPRALATHCCQVR